MKAGDVNFWRIHCHIGHHPGQWQFWFREQCCAVGWPPPEWRGKTNPHGGWRLRESYPSQRDFAVTQNHLARMMAGDLIIATLPNGRVGRIGSVVALQVKDAEWNPIIPPSPDAPFGDNGRRILVRWELATGPTDPSKVVSLPQDAALNSGQRRGTIRMLPIELAGSIRSAMCDESNWVSLAGSFSSERALSDYIAVHPDRLESGMIAHPLSTVRELAFEDKSRADVILQDRAGTTVVVECKQDAPSISALNQVQHYRSKIRELMPGQGEPRAMVVHGGARRVARDVAELATTLDIELVHFDLQVNFSGTSATSR